MVTAADAVPEDDWTLVGRSDPKVEPGCLSIDIACVRLSATWSVDHDVNIDDVGSRIGVDMDGARPGLSSGCLVHDRSGNSRTEICVNENPKSTGEYLVSINMSRD